MSSLFPNGRSAATLFLHAQTGLHPGTGTALGVVDLPVQRERHTQWPTIAGSALKGILRDVCREKVKTDYPNGESLSPRRWANEKHQMLVTAFGPGSPDESSEHAGALAVSDARILAFPVRSLKGVFAWVTCPAVLERFNRDLALVGLPPSIIFPPFRTTRSLVRTIRRCCWATKARRSYWRSSISPRSQTNARPWPSGSLGMP